MLIDHMFVDVVFPIETFAERAFNLLRWLRIIPSFWVQLMMGRHDDPVEAVQVVQVVVLHGCEVADVQIKARAGSLLK